MYQHEIVILRGEHHLRLYAKTLAEAHEAARELSLITSYTICLRSAGVTLGHYHHGRAI